MANKYFHVETEYLDITLTDAMSFIEQYEIEHNCEFVCFADIKGLPLTMVFKKGKNGSA